MENKLNPNEKGPLISQSTIDDVRLAEHIQNCPQDSDCAEDARGPHTNFVEELKEARQNESDSIDALKFATEAVRKTNYDYPVGRSEVIGHWEDENNRNPIEDMKRLTIPPENFRREIEGSWDVVRPSRQMRRMTTQIGLIVKALLGRDERIGVLVPTVERAEYIAHQIIDAIRPHADIKWSRRDLQLHVPLTGGHLKFVSVDQNKGQAVNRLRGPQWSTSVVDSDFKSNPHHEILEALELGTRLGRNPMMLGNWDEEDEEK